jgi:hypothetical protein
MNSFKDPLVPLIAQPVGIDIPIQELQVKLASLGWLEKSFGRSWTAVRKDAQGRIIYYPEVWQGMTINNKDRDLLNVMPNDNLKSQSFFKVEDPIETIDYAQDLYNIKRAQISIIFWFDLRQIDKTLNYRFIELLKSLAETAIKTHSFTPASWASIEILRSWEEPASVFKGYTINLVEQQELIHPWGGFRLDCRLNYRENCPAPVLP